MKLGDRAEIARTFTQDDVDAYIGLGGAPSEGVPEPMIGALFSYLLGVRLPGPGTNYLTQSLDFEHAAEIGAPLTASVEITQLRPEKALVDFATICRNAQGETVCTGRALVRVKDVGG
jgi:acyl dehydratase